MRNLKQIFPVNKGEQEKKGPSWEAKEIAQSFHTKINAH